MCFFLSFEVVGEWRILGTIVTDSLPSVVLLVSTVAPRAVTDGVWQGRREGAIPEGIAPTEDAARRRQRRLECERICGEGHKCCY